MTKPGRRDPENEGRRYPNGEEGEYHCRIDKRLWYKQRKAWLRAQLKKIGCESQKNDAQITELEMRLANPKAYGKMKQAEYLGHRAARLASEADESFGRQPKAITQAPTPTRGRARKQAKSVEQAAIVPIEKVQAG
jgi:hypothetical protein